jgi:hypothetical protein
MLPILKKINTNPNIAVFSCCSGHDGHPYLWVFFKTPEVRAHYINNLKNYKVTLIQPDDGDYIDIPGTHTVREKRGRQATKQEITKFWNDLVNTLFSY